MFKTILFTGISGKQIQNIVRVEDYAFIPADESNLDYQDYQRWLAEGNTPEVVED